MATTAKGTPYVVSTDLVANYPTVSSDLATHIDAKLAYNAVTINAQTGTTYTFALADASEGKLVTASNAAASTYTVPPQSSVTWADGAVLRILNQGAGTVTIAAGSGVTINGTPLTLAQYKGAAIQRTASNTWTFVPFSGGVGDADFSNAATGTYTSGGINYKYVSFLNSGTLTVTTAGLADVLLVAGGGGGGSGDANRGGGGGAGGYWEESMYLPSGSISVTVGAGGANNTQGNSSILADVAAAPGGGCGQNVAGAAFNLGASGGGGRFSGPGSPGFAPYGNTGGNSTAANSPGAGGGAGGAATTSTAGVGIASSITNASVTRAAGGGIGTGANGAANTGDGGFGSAQNANGGSGGSGVVIIRVRT